MAGANFQEPAPDRDPDIQDILEAFLALEAAQRRTDRALGEIHAIAQSFAPKHTPRNRFNRWRNSADGKAWKAQQYKSQGGRCALCDRKIPLRRSPIDHIVPLAIAPHRACDPSNLQITCADCNEKKGHRSPDLKLGDEAGA
jgi:5-methylcytosine-specific restriction endonuclease McrA